MNFQVIDEIRVKEPVVEKGKVVSNYNIDGKEFKINFKYSPLEIKRKHAEILSLMPIVNYSLFTKHIYLDFPVEEKDLVFFKEVLRLNSIEIYVNKLIKRPEFFKPEFIPREPNRTDAAWTPEIHYSTGQGWEHFDVDHNSVAIMSSGGKESLLTYGLMREAGANVYPIYFNESGAHWKTALPAYRYMKSNDSNTMKIWSDIDRFYRSVNSLMPIFRPGALDMWSDTYPIQLFIFPVYIFASLPYIEKYSIGNVLKGDEFDDPKGFQPTNGIEHFYGILDQSKFFDDLLTDYFGSVGIKLKFFSAVRHITGMVEEKILYDRYPELLRLQRSCHSCHYEGKEIVPCGKCSKCNGILLFLEANKIDPKLLNYREEDIVKFRGEYLDRLYRLDESERDHAIFKMSGGVYGKYYPAVEKIHFCRNFSPEDTIPEKFRDKIIEIFRSYTNGYEIC